MTNASDNNISFTMSAPRPGFSRERFKFDNWNDPTLNFIRTRLEDNDITMWEGKEWKTMQDLRKMILRLYVNHVPADYHSHIKKTGKKYFRYCPGNELSPKHGQKYFVTESCGEAGATNQFII